MKEIDAMYQACEEMCQRCPCFVVCRDDDTKLCDAYLMRMNELEANDDHTYQGHGDAEELF